MIYLAISHLRRLSIKNFHLKYDFYFRLTIDEQVRSPIYFNPAINNRAPPSEWKPIELPADINGTESSWPPVWYLEREGPNNDPNIDDNESSTVVSVTSLSATETSTPYQGTTTHHFTDTATPLEENEIKKVSENLRTKISTAVLARLCLFQNICSQEKAQEYILESQIPSTTTERITTTNAPSKSRRPRKRNPVLVAQIRACMQDSKYCDTNTFNEQREMAIKRTTKENFVDNDDIIQRFVKYNHNIIIMRF